MDNNRRRTRNYFPEPKFQLRFLAFLVGGSAMQIAVTNLLLYYFLQRNYGLLLKYAALDTQVSQLLSTEFRYIVALITLTFVVFLIGITSLGIIFSHRIAGPLYAIRRTVNAILDGKDVKLSFRQGDEFVELIEKFNQMVDTLKQPKSTGRRASGERR